MKKLTALLASGLCLVVLAAAGRAWATAEGSSTLLQANEFQVTFDANGHSLPVIGQDAIGYYVVYMQYPVVNGVMGNASIYYQRIANGALSGTPVAVANSTANQWLNDADGDYIVYTISPAVGQLGNIALYQISTGQTRMLTTAGNAWEPKIRGDVIAWVEITPDGFGQAKMYRISNVQTSLIAGPNPSVSQLVVGNRFIVWSQLVYPQYDLAAYDLQTGTYFDVASDPQLNETTPSTEGPWITYQTQAPAAASIAIMAVNMDTGERRTIVDNGAYNERPNLSGNLITYESNASGSWQIYVYRIQQGDTFQVTHNTYNEHLNGLKDNLVAYIDNRSGYDEVYVSTIAFINNPPVANAGPNQTLNQLNSPVPLDGSGSTGINLTYAWSVASAPTGSTATFSNPNIVNPTFTPDKWGNYVLKLTVTDAYGATSSGTMNLSLDSIPVAAATATPQGIVLHGTTVTLDGSQSYDDDGDTLTYSWTLSKPQNSNAALSDPSVVKPTFVADVFGDYNVLLTVTDSVGNSGTATVMVGFGNLPPVANAGNSQAVPMGATVFLDGSRSSDPNHDTITYQWSFVSKPQGSLASLNNATSITPSFTADWPGTYVVQLIVNDGQVNCITPATVQIQVSASQLGVTTRLHQLSALIGTSIPPSAFKNNNMRNALLNKLNVVVSSIDAGNYPAALNQLQNDILPKTDGCANSNPPAPDKDDWIKSCDAQALIYMDVMDLITLVQDLM